MSNIQNSRFLGRKWPKMGKMAKMRIFPKNLALSLLSLYGPLTSWKIPEKTNEPILRKNLLTDGRTDLRGSNKIIIFMWWTIIVYKWWVSLTTELKLIRRRGRRTTKNPNVKRQTLHQLFHETVEKLFKML